MSDEPTPTVHANGTKMWRLHGALHRVSAPAVEWANGSKEWWLHGELHRVGGPAIEWANGNKMWYLHGELHREDAPAVERANGSKEWWLHNKHYATAESWAVASLTLQNKPHDAASVDAFLKQILKKQVQNAL